MSIPTGPIFKPGPFPFWTSLVVLRSTVPFYDPLITGLLGLFRFVNDVIDVINLWIYFHHDHYLS